MSNPPLTRYCVVVPVKPAAYAKSRMAALGDEARQALVLAFALDTVAAALASPRVGAVLVVTDDHVLARSVAALGAEVVPDPVVDDLNESLQQGAVEAARRWPSLAPAALCADLPALVADHLTRALEEASRYPAAFVPDAAGSGTTMLAAVSGEAFRPRFGPGSREAHAAEGAHELGVIDVPTLRRDVDTPEDLRAALARGVGSHTTAAVAGLAGVGLARADD